jgi:hypothetical protein
VQTRARGVPPAEFCRLLGHDKLNLPFLTCSKEGDYWGLNLVVESHNARALSQRIQLSLGEPGVEMEKAVVLSIFPHRNNPEVMGAVLEVFGRQGIDPIALASSPSAVSFLLPESIVDRATAALFDPFQFSTYRTPADWKLAQAGKEKLYKEVVASYQERRPKVYALEWRDDVEVLHVRLNRGELGALGSAFLSIAQLELTLNFLISTPSQTQRETNLLFCLPPSADFRWSQRIRQLLSGSAEIEVTPATLFSMNGPHFGDRYGIAGDLLTALDDSQAELLGLSCSIASITGVIPLHQTDSALQAITGCFDVPSVIKKS